MINIIRLIFGLVMFICFVGCGESSSSSKEIDFSKYLFPNRSVIYDYIDIEHSNNGEEGSGIETYDIEVDGNLITYNSTRPRIYTIDGNDTIHTPYGDAKRYIKEGDTAVLGETCEFESKIKSFRHKYIEYSGDIEYLENFRLSTEEQELYRGDIVKIKCITQRENLRDVFYIYFQKNVGYIVSINDDCYSDEKNNIYDTEGCTKTAYDYQFYVNDKIIEVGRGGY